MTSQKTPLMKHCKLLIASFLISIFLLGGIDLRAELVVTPKNQNQEKALFYRAKPGETINDSFDILNTNSESSTFSLQVNDFMVTDDGAITLLQNSEKNYNLGNWVEMKTGQILSTSNTKVNIPFKITIPLDAKSGEYGAGVSLLIQNTDNLNANIRNVVRKGLKIYVYVDDGSLPVLSSNVSDLNFLNPEESAKNENNLKFWDKNNMVINFKAVDDGNTFSVIKGSYEITYSDGQRKSGTFSTNLAPNSGEKEYKISTQLPYKSGKTSIKLIYAIEALNANQLGKTDNKNISGELSASIDLSAKTISNFRGIDTVENSAKENLLEKKFVEIFILVVCFILVNLIIFKIFIKGKVSSKLS